MSNLVGLTKLERRRLMGSSSLPWGIAMHYTQGQRAVIEVISQRVKRSGSCALTHARIGKFAGVGVSTVRQAINTAEANGHLSVHRRPVEGESNVITIDFDLWAALDQATET